MMLKFIETSNTRVNDEKGYENLEPTYKTINRPSPRKKTFRLKNGFNEKGFGFVITQ
jgi:hypothetical protein